MLKWRQTTSRNIMEFAPPPRSCQVSKWPDFNGYGFTLHNNKELGIQSIGSNQSLISQSVSQSLSIPPFVAQESSSFQHKELHRSYLSSSMQSAQLFVMTNLIMIEGNVDENSPAAAAGLKTGDIIIEINGVNVTRENHGQIVARIKASGDSTVFLVAEKECRVRYSQI